MTNLEKIRSMSDEELLKFLAIYIDASDLNPRYCLDRCPHSDEYDDCGYECSDEVLIKDWLDSECDQ